MSAEETIEFENAHFLQSLFAEDLSLLKVLEERIGVTVTTRDAWIKFQGQEEAVAKAKGVFTQLEAARRGGAEISRHFFNFALECEVEGAAEKSNVTLQDLIGARLLGSPRKPAVMPKSRGQLLYLKAIEQNDVVFGVGPAGTGKTYLAMASALAALKSKEVHRVILARPAVEAGEALGFLPGDMQEKIAPYLRPLYDALYDMLEPDEVEKMIDRNLIEIAPLAYMRGRTLSRSFIILDEAQNTTEAQMFMLLTRLGEGSSCVVTGDPSQNDLKPSMRSGLREAMRVLPKTKGVEFVEFKQTDVVRHPVVRRIIAAYESERSRRTAEDPR